MGCTSSTDSGSSARQPPPYYDNPALLEDVADLRESEQQLHEYVDASFAAFVLSLSTAWFTYAALKAAEFDQGMTLVMYIKKHCQSYLTAQSVLLSAFESDGALLTAEAAESRILQRGSQYATLLGDRQCHFRWRLTLSQRSFREFALYWYFSTVLQGEEGYELRSMWLKNGLLKTMSDSNVPDNDADDVDDVDDTATGLSLTESILDYYASYYLKNNNLLLSSPLSSPSTIRHCSALEFTDHLSLRRRTMLQAMKGRVDTLLPTYHHWIAEQTFIMKGHNSTDKKKTPIQYTALSDPPAAFHSVSELSLTAIQATKNKFIRHIGRNREHVICTNACQEDAYIYYVIDKETGNHWAFQWSSEIDDGYAKWRHALLLHCEYVQSTDCRTTDYSLWDDPLLSLTNSTQLGRVTGDVVTAEVTEKSSSDSVVGGVLSYETARYQCGLICVDAVYHPPYILIWPGGSSFVDHQGSAFLPDI